MIEIMSETEDNILVVKATKTLTSQDYEDVFIPQLKLQIDKFGKIRVLIYLDDNFIGWELGAAWDDAVFGVQHRYDFEKVAVVSDKNWVEWATKIAAYFMDGQVATYSLVEFKEAVIWLRQ